MSRVTPAERLPLAIKFRCFEAEFHGALKPRAAPNRGDMSETADGAAHVCIWLTAAFPDE
jgi:hypothetical protein